MRFFGVPTCPYCKKRVNLIRTWSLKRQGEYQCPRCGGISNIFLSPLIYVFALLAVFAGGAVYFFHKFVLDDISLSTVLQVLIPFAVFFLLSLFMVYLAKPVIKKIPKAELEKKKRGRQSFEERRPQGAGEMADRMYYDDQEYLPRMDYRTGPLPREDDQDMKIMPPELPVRKLPEPVSAETPRPAPARRASQPTAPAPSPAQPPRVPQAPQARQTAEVRQTSQVQQAPQVRQAPQETRAVQMPRARQTQTTPQAQQVRETPQVRLTSQARQTPQAEQPVQPRASRADAAGYPRASSARRVTSVDVPSVSNEDFFAKYDDPEYVERRLRELKESRTGDE